MYEAERETAVEIVAEVCDLTRRVQDAIVAAGDALTKGDRSPVTLADLAAQVVVSLRLARRFPDDPLLAEEDSAALAASADMTDRVLHQARKHFSSLSRDELIGALDRGDHPGGGDGRYWVLDPIDGTKGFLRGDQYAVALALVADGDVVVGVLGCPNLPAVQQVADHGSLFSAVRGSGAKSHSLDRAVGEAIHVDAITDPADAVVCESVVAAHAAHSVQAGIAERLGISAPPYRIDSQCKYAVVARGQADAYLRMPTRKDYVEKIWDHAAGSIIAAEAGAVVTDVMGLPLDFGQGPRLEANRGVVCAVGRAHPMVIRAIDELGIAAAV